MSWTCQIVRGEDWSRGLTISDEVDDVRTARDVTGFGFQFVAKMRGVEVLDFDLEDGGVELVDAENGQINLVLTSAETAEIPGGHGRYQLWQTDGDGARTLVFAGPLRIEAGFS